MDSLYVTGGRQRSRFLKTEQEWNLYESGLILRLNVETGSGEVLVDYQTPAEARANEDASILFKGGALDGDRLYVCTSTEVLIYRVPEFTRIGYVSLPCFNDLHHVRPTAEGQLLVVSTGLDMVVESSIDGKVLREWHVLGGEPWRQFSRDVDYRKVATTKPHHSHPNFVFQLGSDVWVTRFDQRDAVCLTDSGQRIEIMIERPHDGYICGETIYFTTVDGNLVLVSLPDLRIREIIDLKTIDNESKALLGWCRGVLPACEGKVWVGFTRVRKTKFTENINWVKHAFRDVEKSTHIALYDIKAKKCLKEIDLEKYGMNIVFGIFPAVDSRASHGPQGPARTELH